MRIDSNITRPRAITRFGRIAPGWGSGFIGVVIFSVSLPTTRLAVAGFPPPFLTSARALIAALLGEPVAPSMLAVAGLTALCVVGAKRHARPTILPVRSAS